MPASQGALDKVNMVLTPGVAGQQACAQASTNPIACKFSRRGLFARFGSLQDMDMDNRLPLYQNIMLSGGTTMLPGLATRLERDLRSLYLTHVLKVPVSCTTRYVLRTTLSHMCALAETSCIPVQGGLSAPVLAVRTVIGRLSPTICSFE